MSLPSPGSARPVLLRLFGASRAFSTSRPVCSNTIPPESPSYIRLPEPPQSDEKRPPRVRGHLPVPREVFPRLEGDRKIRPEYIQQTAPEPGNRPEPTNDAQRWKYRMAEVRRSNLKSGLEELWKRRAWHDKVRHKRVTSKFEANRQAAKEPEREDERLTRATVLDAMLDTKVYPDPDRFKRAERSTAKVRARQVAKSEARRDALVELYINASGFIVHESELKSEIERIFDEKYFSNLSQTSNRYGTVSNVWGFHGHPHSISHMLAATSTRSTKLLSARENELERSANRQKKVAETLTGGKLD